MILTPCDCIGDWLSRFEYKYYPFHTQKVTAGTTFITREDDPRNAAQVRTPYWNLKHPQCMPLMKQTNSSNIWLLYNYGLITLAYPFRYDERVVPVTAVQSGLDANVIRETIFNTIDRGGECKTLSFAQPLSDDEVKHRRLEYTKIKLRPTADCRLKIQNITNFSLYDPDMLFYGKFCGSENFELAGDECFNNLGAPVLCGGLYVGFLGDDMPCRPRQYGRYFMYFRLDLAIPFVMINQACKTVWLEKVFLLLLYLISFGNFFEHFKVKLL
ncbi:hypothetical protein GE061_015962 [Apolygus lucorum]|uniref:Peptidase S1 domain-containing protein n=1 Tax=Apolygus lucorum TaxID=248454 RepID=A0A6A4K3D2_APOLU|nr:hypothetical protein GE061_015962 [Apolygus lucorum]